MQKVTVAALLGLSTLLSQPVSIIDRVLKHRYEQQDSIRCEQLSTRANHGWNQSPDQRSSRAETGSITGILVDSAGTVLKGKSISIYDIFGDEKSYKTTDYTSGAFAFTGLEKGSYTLNSYNGNSSYWYGGATISYEAKFITIDSSETENIGTMVLPVSSAKDTIIVTGTMMDGTVPFTGSFNLHYTTMIGYTNSEYFSTDSTGKFKLKIQSSSGNHYCLITGNSIAPVWLGGEPLNSTPSAVNLGDSTGGFVIPVTKAGVINGILSGVDTTSSFTVLVISEDGYELGSSWQYAKDSTFTISGLPEGSFYLKIEDYNDAFVEGYYPNSGTFASAQKVTVTTGETANVALAMKRVPGSGVGKAYLRKNIVDENGIAVLGDLNLIQIELNGSYTSSSTEVMYGTGLIVAPAGKPFKIRFTPTADTYCETYWNGGKDTTLASGDTLDITIVVSSAGVIEGSLTDVNGKEITPPVNTLGEEGELGYSFGFFTTNGESYETYPDFFKKYRISKVPEGSYDFRVIPGLESDNELISSQLKGLVAVNTGTVSIQKSDTLFRDVQLKEVSGMISGSIALPVTNDALYFVEAVNRNGDVCSYAIFYSSAGADTTNRYHHYFYKNNDLIHDLYGDVTPTPTTCLFSVPVLAQGEYAVRILDLQNLDTDNEQFVEYWYGVSSGKILTGDALEKFESFGGIAVPSGAKFVTLATDSTWIKEVNFGSTATVPSKSMHSVGLKSFAVANGTINCSFNLNGTAGSVAVYGLNGRKLATKSVVDQVGSLVWKPSLSAGTYVFEMVQGTQKISRKFMIQ